MQEINVAGIVTEYNPFHKGHAWMAQRLREQGFDAIVCAMSGPFVQRAEPAFLPTSVRAAAAVAGGVDLVLRLPTPYATASAECFATGSVGLLSALGCINTLAFGAENADTGVLLRASSLLQGKAFSIALKDELKQGVSFAVARSAAAEKLMPGMAQLLNAPNNILGVEYCKALQHSVPNTLANMAAAQAEGNGQKVMPFLPKPFALPRLGAQHDGNPAEGVASASWLRRLALAEGVASLAPWVPTECLPFYAAAVDTGAQIDWKRWEMVLLGRLRGKATQEYEQFPSGTDGLAPRLASAAQRAVSLEELYTLAKTKRFAHSRVRRLALTAGLSLPTTLPTIPPFAQVLAANERGISVLKLAKQASLLPVSTSLTKLSLANPQAAMFAQAEALAEDVYALCQQHPQPGGRAFTQAAAFTKTK